MELITIQRQPLGELEQVNSALLRKFEGELNNKHEHTKWVEYKLKGDRARKIVHRSSHVTLKEWPAGLETVVARLNAGPGITPSDRQPDQVHRRLVRMLLVGGPGSARFANTQAMCSQFKVDILNGLHAFGASVIRGATTKDSYKAALYLASGSRGAADTVYSTTGELAGTGNYTQGGIAVTTATAPTLSGTTALFTPSASLSWAALTSSGSFDCMVLYNDTSSTKLEVAVFTFSAQSITAGTFTLTMPANTVGNALIQIS